MKPIFSILSTLSIAVVLISLWIINHHSGGGDFGGFQIIGLIRLSAKVLAIVCPIGIVLGIFSVYRKEKLLWLSMGMLVVNLILFIGSIRLAKF